MVAFTKEKQKAASTLPELPAFNPATACMGKASMCSQMELYIEVHSSRECESAICDAVCSNGLGFTERAHFCSHAEAGLLQLGKEALW